jgi:hypothetical protein
VCRFLLKCRIRTLTSLSFKEREQTAFCFRRWRLRVNVVLMLDRLEFRVESQSLGRAFATWKEATRDPLVPVSQQLIDAGQSVVQAVALGVRGAIEEAKASRRDGYNRVRTAANVLLGRSNAESLIHGAQELQQAATTAYETVGQTVQQANVLTSSVKVYVAQKVPIKKMMATLQLPSILERALGNSDDDSNGSASAGFEDPIEQLLQQRQLEQQHELTRRSRMMHALVFARSHPMTHPLTSIANLSPGRHAGAVGAAEVGHVTDADNDGDDEEGNGDDDGNDEDRGSPDAVAAQDSVRKRPNNSIRKSILSAKTFLTKKRSYLDDDIDEEEEENEGKEDDDN